MIFSHADVRRASSHGKQINAFEVLKSALSRYRGASAQHKAAN
jgi:hypothetical protein